MLGGGDTLFTRTEVVGLRKNSAKPGRAPTGLAALRMTTVDQVGRLMLDFYRCAMLPLSPGADPAATAAADDLVVHRWRYAADHGNRDLNGEASSKPPANTG